MNNAPIGDGGPAFPTHPPIITETGGRLYGENGQSLRDYFAAKALQGIMANANGLGTMAADRRAELLAGTAALLYEIADAMLKARQS